METPEVVSKPNLYLWIINHFQKSRVTIHAGHVTFFMLLSFFPFVMFLLTILHSTNIIDLNQLRDTLAELKSGFIGQTIIGWIDDIISTRGVFMSAASIIVLIWSGSKGFDGLAQGLDSIYGARGKRGYVKRRLFSMVHLVNFVLMVVFSMILLVFGSLLIRWLSEELPWFRGIQFLVSVVRYLMIAVIFLIYFVLMYRFIPYTPTESKDEIKARKIANKGLPKNERKKRPIHRTIRKELPGALLASITWIVFSRLYGFYMSYQVEHASIYGSLTAFFLTLLWLYYCMMFIFIGGLYNHYSYATGESATRHIFKDIPGLFRWIIHRILHGKSNLRRKKREK